MLIINLRSNNQPTQPTPPHLPPFPLASASTYAVQHQGDVFTLPLAYTMIHALTLVAIVFEGDGVMIALGTQHHKPVVVVRG